MSQRKKLKMISSDEATGVVADLARAEVCLEIPHEGHRGPHQVLIAAAARLRGASVRTRHVMTNTAPTRPVQASAYVHAKNSL